jgi:nicotinate-nucleotide adenylyltransferase
VSDWEIHQSGPSYSWQTAEHFIAQSQVRLHWLMGADQWSDLERWARPDFLREHLVFIVFARAGEQPQERPGWRSIFLPEQFPGSSTEVRRRIGAGESGIDLLPPPVEEYILSEGLYRQEGRQ